MLIRKGYDDFKRYGKQYFVSINVPLVFTLFIKSYFFIDIFNVGLRSIAEALFIKISIFPNVEPIF